MPGSKIFAGIRLRRMRIKLGLNQTSMAQSLGISASYLNLIERDQRPVTAQIILKLSAMPGIDISELTGGDQDSDMLVSLKEMVADPLLAGEIPVASELTDAAQVAPNLVGAALKLFRAYREILKRLADLSQEIAVSGAVSSMVAESPFETVRRWLLEQAPYFPVLEGLAEDIGSELSPKDDPMASIKARLRSHSGIDVRVLPTSIMAADRSRYDRHSQRLFLSERLSGIDRLFEAAFMVASLEGRDTINTILAQTSFAAMPESVRLARRALLQRLTMAILCPAGRFATAAQDLRFDIPALSARFSVDPSTTMIRLATVSARADSEFQIGSLSVDVTGAVTDRTGQLGIYLSGNGALCGRLPVFDRTGGLDIAILETSENDPIVMVSICAGPGNAATAICFSKSDLEKTVYDALAQAFPSRQIGPSCRLCDVKNCHLRREPPAARPAVLNEFVRGATEYEPVA